MANRVGGPGRISSWVVPASEDLEAGQKAGAQFYDWLEVGRDFVRLKRPAKVGLVVVGHTERKYLLL